jgi:alkylation response protein AidB-like acyl-CoA dehydrogenase
LINYEPPLDEFKFLLHEYLKVSEQDIPGFKELTPEFTSEILEMGAKIAKEVMLPLNRSGDLEGCKFENGLVRTPSGFVEAFTEIKKGGWPSLDCDPLYGGQGLPMTLSLFLGEMFSSCNISLTIYQALTHGAYAAILAHGSDSQKKLYLPKLVSCEWTGTMNLTEPHCGTDLGMIKTKAVPQSGDSYKITGQKIFISSGDHDLSENIIHLVLAKIPGGPDGVKGISLFLVPKFLVNPDGNIGERNTLSVGSIEKKMGIHGNATCVLNYDGATGYLLGEKHKGLKAMFTMMNEARLGVGLQSLALAEIAYQNSVKYAKERVQGKSFQGDGKLSTESQAIISHPDIRKSLLEQKSFIEGARALTFWTALLLERGTRLSDKKALGLASLLTPVIKAYTSDIGFNMTIVGQQIFGGHGYIEEWGMSQIVRDSRIAMIYEGANGVQAIDLIGRKLNSDGGANILYLCELVKTFIKEKSAIGDLETDFLAPLKSSFQDLEEALKFFLENGIKNPNSALAGASDFLHLLGTFCTGFMWAQMIAILLEKKYTSEAGKNFKYAKIITGKFYMENILPKTGYLSTKIKAGDKTIMSLEKDQF